MALVSLNSQSFAGARDRTRSVLSGFTLGQKVVTVLAVAGVVVAGVVFMHVESSPNYQPLFTNLQSSDAGTITAQLATAKVPYQLTNGGSTVLVPANDVNQERVALAEQGLPGSGTVGFSALEKSGITTSEFVQQIEYQQALEGQLEQTIESISGVESAQVSLVVPQQSDFAVGPAQATTASILVDLAPGTKLSGNQVQAIEHLAASATPGLTTSNVTVVDNSGDVLSAKTTTGQTGSSDSAETASYDNQLSGSIEGLLDRVVGVGNSAVQVHALLNFNQQSTTTTGLQTNPQGQAVTAATSKNTTNATYKGSGTPPSGVLGAGVTTTNGSGTYTSTNSQVTNAVGQVTQTVKEAPGQVQKTSVAVLLNSSAKPKVSTKRIQALVAAAAGLNVANGDQLVVTAMPFAKTASSETGAIAAAESANRLHLIEHGGEIAALVALILAMLVFALRASRRPVYDEVHVDELSPVGARNFSHLDDPIPLGEHATARLPREDALPPAAVLSQVNNFIEQRPAEVARLLRAWAEEGTETA
ncbi:MAG TPA: flagellar basal-body MS-ring/collar protein FliF [Acidimicrobiales bacterium]|nr:flagellar basal-body MS-ring/collar protein FliF [Acidimicrobiales bacterium]